MSTPFKLYELSDAISQVADMIEEGTEGLEDTLEALDCSFQDKVESILKLWRSKQAEQEAIDKEAARLKRRSDKLAKDAAWLHGYVEREMLRANVTEVKSPVFGIKIGANPPSVNITNIDLIPGNYLRIKPATYEPNKVAIKEAIGKGEIVPGCELKTELKLKVR